METTTQDLVKVDAFKQQIDTVPGIMVANENSAIKAIEVATTLLAKIQQSGMNDAIDTEANNLLVKIRKTYELLQERRKPVTGLFDSIKKIFTEFEGKIDPKGKDNIYYQLQNARNAYATKKAEAQRLKEEEVRKKAAIEQERINVKTTIELQLKQYFNAYLEDRQRALVDLFEGMQLETFEESKSLITKFPAAYSFSHFDTFPFTGIVFHYLTQADIQTIVTNVKAGKFEAFGKEFNETIEGLKQVFADKLPSKKAELEAIANSNAEEKKRLEAEAEARRKAEQDRIANEAIEKNNQAVNQSETDKSVLQANTLFELQSDLAQNASTAQVREGYEITVTNPAGYLQLVAFYFEKEGLKEGIDKLEKKTLGSMKKFAEDFAKKNGEQIKNAHLVYKETFKVTAKKA